MLRGGREEVRQEQLQGDRAGQGKGEKAQGMGRKRRPDAVGIHSGGGGSHMWVRGQAGQALLVHCSSARRRRRDKRATGSRHSGGRWAGCRRKSKIQAHLRWRRNSTMLSWSASLATSATVNTQCCVSGAEGAGRPGKLHATGRPSGRAGGLADGRTGGRGCGQACCQAGTCGHRLGQITSSWQAGRQAGRQAGPGPHLEPAPASPPLPPQEWGSHQQMGLL